MSDRVGQTLWVWVAVMLAFVAFTPGQLRAADADEIRTVIEAQLAAFAADDAPKAYSFASPNIQHMFGTPEDFLMMVKSQYPVVYRPNSVLFRPLQAVDGASIQVVQMSDAAGRVWLAAYKMQKQADGTWRIDGCPLREAESRST